MKKSPLKNFRSQMFAVLLILAAGFSGITSQNQVYAQTSLNPEITSVTPNTLRAEGGAEVVITGKNFSSGTMVILGGDLVKNATLTANEIRFLATPQAIAGAKTLTVLNNNGIAQKELRIIDKSLAGLLVGEMTTIAGGESSTGDGELATKANFGFLDPQGFVYDKDGNLFIMEQTSGQIRRIDAKTGVVNTVVGLGNSSKDGDLAVLARVQPVAIAVGQDGSLFISDALTNSVKRVDALTKTITTVAGGKLGAASGDGGLAVNASLGEFVSSLAIDSNNNLFILSGNLSDSIRTIRKVDSKTGIITRVAGNGVAESSGDGGLAINAGIRPTDIALDSLGNLFIADGNTRVRRVDASTGIITTVAGNGKDGFFDQTPIDGKPATSVALSLSAISLDKDNNLVFVESASFVKVDAKTGLINVLPVGPLSPNETGFGVSGHPTVNSSGNIVFGFNGRIFERIASSPTGEVKQIAGTKTVNFTEDGSTPATMANLGVTSNAVSDISGNVFFNDIRNNYVRKIDGRTGLITTIAGSGPSIIFSSGGGDGKNATSPEVSFMPNSISLDSFSNLYIADGLGERVRRVDALSNIITTFAGNSKTTSLGDGGPAKDASLGNVADIAFDAQGNLFVSAEGRIRRVDANTKIITTIAGNGKNVSAGDNGPATSATGGFLNLTTDPSGNIYVVDSSVFTQGQFQRDKVRRIDSRTGIITTIAGSNNEAFLGENGPATSAGLGYITGLAANSNGDVFISSYKFTTSPITILAPKPDFRIWKVDAKTGNISVLASSDNTSSVKINGFSSLHLDSNENLLVAENMYLGRSSSSIKLFKLSDKVRTSSDVFISNVNYQKPTLTVSGGGFGNNGVTVTVNGQNVTKQMVTQSNDQIVLKGKVKQLNIRKTGNQIIVTTSTGINTSLVFQ